MRLVKYHDNYRFEIFEDDTFSFGSNDNVKTYSNCFALDLNSNFHYSCMHAISVFDGENEISNAILCGEGGATSVHERSNFIFGNSIYICIGNAVASLTIPKLTLNWIQKVDDATAFQISLFQNDIIVHGEMSISRITLSGELVWQKYGSDIFVTNNDDIDFEINGNIIYAQSWDGRRYVFNFDGNPL